MLLQSYFIFLPLHKAIKLMVYNQLVGDALFILSWPLHFETLGCHVGYEQLISTALVEKHYSGNCNPD